MTNNLIPDHEECPSTKQLQDWLNGDFELPAVLQQHLKACERCSKVLATLSDDRELQSLAATSLLNPDRNHQSEPEFLELRQRMNEWALNDVPDSQLDSSVVDSVSQMPFSTERADLAETDRESMTLDMPTAQSLRNRLPAERFSVDRLIAKGGSGAVFLAYDQQLKREVAIKVLGRNSTRDRQRFMREARILADLEHSNIVRVFDFGKLSTSTESTGTRDESRHLLEQLYLVMEYIPGGTAGNLRVDQPCWQRATSPGPSQANSSEQPNENSPLGGDAGRMNFRRLAKLLATAADGLAAAHAKNLVHRDVKPGNLMLTLDWSSIKVADFGLAKLTEIDSTQVTRTGDLLGTPVFMSPEQVAGQENLSASSDIYSLGATLFQLITGEAPFQGSSTAILRQIIEVAPVAPRVLNPQIPVELEIICLHAMEKEPTARYATMAQLADDLRRFSSGQPIHARPVSSATKAVRFLKRNKPFAAALLAISLLLSTLTIGSVIAAVVFGSQNKKLIDSALAESKAKEAAQESLRKAIAAADELLVSVTEDTELLPRAPGSEEVSKKLLKKAQSYYQQMLSSESSNNQLVIFDEARAHSGLAQIANRLGNPDEVEEEAQAAIALLNSLSGDTISSQERALLISKTLGFLGKSLSARGELSKAVEVMTDSVATCRNELKKIEAGSTKATREEIGELRYLLGDSLSLRAIAENMAGDLGQAEATLAEADQIFSDLLKEKPNDPRYLRMLAGCSSTLAVTLVRRDGFEAARQQMERAVELLGKLEVDGQLPVRIRPDRATNLVNLASIEFALGRVDRARELFNRAEEEYSQLAVLEPSVVDHKYKRALTILNSGKVEIAAKNIEYILGRYRSIEPVLTELLEDDPNSQEYLGTLGMIQGNMAVFLRMLDRSDEGLAALVQSNVTLRRYAELIENTPDSLYAISLNHYERSKCLHTMKRIEGGIDAIKESMALSASILQNQPDYLPSRTHQVDEWIQLCDLFASDPVKYSAEYVLAAKSGMDVVKKLLAEIPDLPEYQVAQGVLYSSLSEAHLHAQKPDQAVTFALEGIQYLSNLAVDSEESNVRDAYLYNYQALAEAQGSLLKSLGEQDQQKRMELKKLLLESLQKCREYGASEEELNELTKLLQFGARASRPLNFDALSQVKTSCLRLT